MVKCWEITADQDPILPSQGAHGNKTVIWPREKRSLQEDDLGPKNTKN